MILARRSCSFGLALTFLAAFLVPAVVRAEGSPGKESPSGDAPEGAPRSRLTLSGAFNVDTYSQKNFFLGARGGLAGKGEFDAFWTQRLTLQPRLILSDDLNVTLKMDLAHGVWGIDGGTAGQSAAAELATKRKGFLDLQVNRAYLSWRHRPTSTRWYLGRQEFALGNRLVLDEEAPGIQAWHDLSGGASFGLGFAKESESGSLADYKETGAGLVPDGRDADLFVAEGRLGTDGRGLFLNPFLARYVDRSDADGSTLLPDGHEFQARFRPNVTRATVAGIAASQAGASLRVDAELDWIKGFDRVKNEGTGTNEAHDINNGDLKGMNVYGKLTWTGEKLELSGTGARGSGDDDPFRTEGNLNSLHNQGHWFLTEVWENGLSLEDVGIAPQGLGNPDVRGYRGLENTTAIQAAASYRVGRNLKVGASWTMLRATKALKPWFDANGDGVISLDEYGTDFEGKGGPSTELGSELDGRIDWTLQDRVTLTLRGGIFSPGIAAGNLVNGTGKYQESPFGLRLNISVPIPEFSLGG